MDSLYQTCKNFFPRDRFTLLKARADSLAKSLLGQNFINIYSKAYPELLREIYDPPLVLSFIGDLSLFSLPKVAIVGTRKASPVSLLATKLLVERLGETSIPTLALVSGMAMGVDRQVFITAMDQGLAVIGLLGTSIQEEYPPSNRDLYKKVKAYQKHLLLTEYIHEQSPSPWTFPKRNRLISGLAPIVYIMESGKKSGTISTAHSALSQNREIVVFDHSLQYDNEGGRVLVSEGADVLNFEDLIEGKGQVIRSDVYPKKVLSFQEWQVYAKKETSFALQPELTPLGSGYIWKPFT
ncbi:DNA-processing protein DprA [Leptospira ryugenii]|uniref:DNA-processing protein DprA n=1 Tax=Leptospira ryugenii TaxID=1917863 RepID=UPI001FCE4AA5|nr:DNA-processing protein DprA [Leptospira ryugenii]